MIDGPEMQSGVGMPKKARRGKMRRPPLEQREAMNMSRGIWRAEDSEDFLISRIVPVVERQLGKGAMRGGRDIYLTRETRVKHPTSTRPKSYRTYMMEIAKDADTPFRATFDILDVFHLTDPEVIIEWPSIQASGLGEDLVGDVDEDDEAQEFLEKRAAALEIIDADDMDRPGGRDALTLINFGEPILTFALRSFELRRRKKPQYNCEYGYVYEEVRYAAYNSAVDGALANRRLIGDTIDEAMSFGRIRTQIGDSIDTPQFDELEAALKALGL